jgi:hypothetical protein
MKLFFSNQKFQVKKDTPTVALVKEWLTKQKKGELFESWQVHLGAGVGMSSLMDAGRALREYQHKHKNKMYWGNKATITQFKKEIQKHGNG